MKIHRRNFLRAGGIAVGGSFLISKDLFAGLFGKTEFEMKALRNNIGIFTERGGTIAWYLAKDGIIVIDTEFPEQAGHLVGEIKKKYDQAVDLLMNTHHHRDHTAGNIAFKGLAKKVVAHSNSLKNQKRVAENDENSPEQLYPDTTFDDTLSMKVGSEQIKAHYYGNAHTDGDSVIHFENSNIVHMGDLIFNRRFPFIDYSAGASIRHWISVLEDAQKNTDGDTLFIFGHAAENYPVTGSQDDLKAMANYLDKLLKFVGSGIKAGKSAEEMAASSKVVPGAEEWTGGGFERNIQNAYDELTAM